MFSILFYIYKVSPNFHAQNIKKQDHRQKFQQFHQHHILNLTFEIMFVCLMMFNATFNNISVILWRSVFLVEETGGPGENHRPVTSH
jgi:hypothetical protein